MTIHHTPNDVNEGLVANTVASLQQKDKTPCSSEETIIDDRILQQREKETVLTSFASSKSPSVQTIISNVERRISGTFPTVQTLAKEDGRGSVDNKSQISPKITLEEEWL